MNAVATLAMVGLIWFVQVVHYPLLSRLERAGIAEHQRRTGYVVAAPMALEAVTAALLVVDRPAGVPAAAAWIGAALVAVVWASTAVLQVPAHRALAGGSGDVRRLVAGNWVRTVAWSGRGAVVAWMLAAVT